MQPMPFVLLAIVLHAGCSAPAHDQERTGVDTALRIDFEGQGEDIVDTVVVDLGSRPTAAMYEEDGEEHPDYFSAHDQLVQWSQESGTEVEVEHSSFGYYLARIDGVPEDTSSYFWSLAVNGTTSFEGMSTVKVVEGSTIKWTLTEIEKY
jgi:hypothetical protein